jgi:hypothetical protein
MRASVVFAAGRVLVSSPEQVEEPEESDVRALAEGVNEGIHLLAELARLETASLRWRRSPPLLDALICPAILLIFPT